MARPRKHALPSIETLRAYLDYDPETGEFRHKARPTVDQPHLAQWNSRYAGKIAGCPMNVGYWILRVDDRAILGHRVAWAHYYGAWPPELDHKDGDKLNNSIDNLRPATRRQNGFNRPGRARSGYKGVKRSNSKVERYNATIMVAGVSRHLGTFDTAELAHAAYKRAARADHREFANFTCTRFGTIAATIQFGVAA